MSRFIAGARGFLSAVSPISPSRAAEAKREFRFNQGQSPMKRPRLFNRGLSRRGRTSGPRLIPFIAIRIRADHKSSRPTAAAGGAISGGAGAKAD
jgi:hypothetical protein